MLFLRRNIKRELFYSFLIFLFLYDLMKKNKFWKKVFVRLWNNTFLAEPP